MSDEKNTAESGGNVESETDSDLFERSIRIAAILVIVASLYGLLKLHGVTIEALGEVFLFAVIGGAARVLVALSPTRGTFSIVGPAVESPASASLVKRAVEIPATASIVEPAVKRSTTVQGDNGF
jgi:hypothetical protein